VSRVHRQPPAPTPPRTTAICQFAAQYPDTCEAQTIIISAWNENDEGHWIMPSLHNGTAKLEAVQRGIRAAKAAVGHL